MSNDDLEQKPSRRLWSLAALAALALHLGGAALAVAHLQGSRRRRRPRRQRRRDRLRDGVAQGRPTTSCRPDRTPMHRMASPQLAEQKAEVKETELPKDKPNEAETPDRIVTENEFEEAEGGRSEGRGGADAGFRPSRSRRRRPHGRPWMRRRRRRTRRGRPTSASARTGRGWPPIGAARSAPISSCTSAIRK